MSYRSVDFDTVAPLMPFDKTASMVAGKGESFEWNPGNRQKVHSRDPLATRLPTERERALPGFQDLTGKRFGRFTVQGIAAEIITTNGQNWVVRCVCGSFETRKAKSIKSSLSGSCVDPEPMCESCNYTRKLQQGYHNPKKAAAAAEAIQSMKR